ncbi:hypothetical protein MmiHf6_14560 [Methanimicrococcus hongohii]|uniref:Uncharacterized protein n=1 Tax=Methanimicrococcus hongohii TaxID=3028295 RepID=A0AA96ZUU2_9EURY|nr:hypothetical protein [Methanimicrococcus sp. Hf6]WNY24127.1 hypothetical protein MmiHf6_14560 [Methanimicrococcus sp. Hf6]
MTPFEIIAAVFIAAFFIIMPLIILYFIVKEAKADGLEAANNHDNPGWKRFIGSPKTIFPILIIVLISVLTFSFVVNLIFPIMIYLIVREYVKQKELKRIRESELSGE